MSFTEWLPVLAICILGAITPGPSLAVVLRNTVNGSRLHGVATGVTHSLGIVFYALTVTTGIAVLITQTPAIFHLITWGGALYLSWIAVQALRSEGSAFENADTETNTNLTIWEASKQGFLIAFLNPKIAIFFLALFSQFVKPGGSVSQQAILVATPAIIDGLWYSLVALVLSHPRLMPALQRKAGLINKLTGIVLLLIAVRIVFL